ncbi:MAG: imidazole glycerol phosphate synthase subunit HisH [Sedimentisphaerales bacterium]
MIVVIDYNVGNVRSVCNAFRHIGCEVVLSNEPEKIECAAGIVLPGVAAFGYAIRELGKLSEPIKRLASDGKPMLGICVGYQMLFDHSSEYGQHRGLGLISGDVIPIPAGSPMDSLRRTIPHMGWNQVKLPEDMDLFAELGKEKNFYFAHSFYASVTDHQAKVAYTDYGFSLAASVQKENIYGVQFHPEKSGRAGLKVLENFSKICEKC